MTFLNVLNSVEIFVIVYLCLGVALGIGGLHRKVPELEGGSRGFRVILYPSLIVLWPLIVHRLVSPAREHSNYEFQKLRRLQTPIFIFLALSGLFFAGLAVSSRQSAHDTAPPAVLNSQK